jgi:hypothetical protein
MEQLQLSWSEIRIYFERSATLRASLRRKEMFFSST